MKTINSNRLYLDLHVLQTLPPSNINRDDTGSPKTAQYGGVRRARVSSQAWKRAIRTYFHEFGVQANVGVRTLNIVEYVAEQIMQLSPETQRETAMKLAEAVINNAGVKTKDSKAKALFFLGDIQARKLAKAAIDGESDKKVLQNLLKEQPAIDIALFGRMVADDPSLNEDASCQVAHAISTHAVETEFDFYTAVDDLAPEDNAGAGMLGTVEYNSSTLYRYANISIHELIEQLGNVEVTENTVKLFIKAFANSMPTGKSNTFANNTFPQVLVIILRKDRPVNLVTAYENAIRSQNGYAKESAARLYQELERSQQFVEEPLLVISLDTLNSMPSELKAQCAGSLSEALDMLAKAVHLELEKIEG